MGETDGVVVHGVGFKWIAYCFENRIIPKYGYTDGSYFFLFHPNQFSMVKTSQTVMPCTNR